MSRTTKRNISSTLELVLILILVLGGVTLPPIPAHADSYVFSVLAVGGGGGGGASQDTEGAAGGGAGGYRETTLSMDEGSHAITIGSGGASGTSGAAGNDGGDSSISTLLTATGGGSGGGTSSTAGSSGGSGGGGSAHSSGGGSGGSGTVGQGNAGGAGGNSGEGGGAGGGASAVGTAGDGTDGGDGGAGTATSISGSSTTYAGGGGGGGSSSISGGSGGTGGGGGGGAGPSGAGTAGTANTGGGGGGGAGSAGDGASGGSGVVIVRYLTTDLTVGLGGTITTDGLYTVHTFTSGGTFSFSLSPAVDPPLTGMSDTLSVSVPASASNHLIIFTVPGGVPAGGSFSIDFQGTTSVFATGSVDYTDIDVDDGSELDLLGCGSQAGATWGVCISGSEIHFQSATGVISTNATITIEIGTNAEFDFVGDAQLTNPSATSGTRISFDTFDLLDASIGQGGTFVAIIPQVNLSATIEDTFIFVLAGVTSAATLDEGADAADVTSTATLVPFGTLVAETPVMGASSLSVTSNALNGFIVTVEQNHNMLASSGADIDCFANGSTCGDTGEAGWSSPTGVNGSEDTYGHLGLYTEDGTGTDITVAASISGTTGDNGTFFGLSGTTAVEIWDNDSTGDGSTQDTGHIQVIYRVEITGLQESGTYTNQLMYIATPTF